MEISFAFLYWCGYDYFMSFVRRFFGSFDWIMLGSAVLLVLAGVVTMASFDSVLTSSAAKQLGFLVLALIVFFTIARFDIRFFNQSKTLLILYFVGIVALGGLFIFGSTIKGAQSWYDLGVFSLQPSDPMKLAVILILAKYLSWRHVEIAHIKHLFITMLYAGVPVFLVLLQPDFGTALMYVITWFGMIVVAGVTRKHVLVLAIVGIISCVLLWFFALQPYQKTRIVSFLNPLADVSGAGYNAYQSMIAVGSGQVLGKGVGYGTQSRLSFLPEHETDFIFASFAEEWGFVGSVFVLFLYVVLIFRVVIVGVYASNNFEALITAGVAFYFLAHILVNIGMNIGLLPVTGVTAPFLSYGGSHLVTGFAALGLVESIRRRYTRVARFEDTKASEILGVMH